MDELKLVPGRLERYYGDQLVVDLGDLKLVERELDRLGVHPGEERKDDRLRLALLELPGLAEEKAELERRAAWNDDGAPDVDIDDKVRRAIERVRGERADFGVPPDPPDLDLLLTILRARFAHRYDRWTPTIGKNRRVELARGFPHLGGGLAGGSGAGDPEPIDEPAEFTSGSYQGEQQQPEDGGIRVAVLDTRVAATHPFLVGRLIAAPDATTPEESGTRRLVMAGHATFVCGLVLLRAPRARLEVHRVLNAEAVGDTWEAARKIAQVADAGVQVINLSWGCYTDDGQAPLVLARAVDRLGSDAVIVVAAGNHGDIVNRPLRLPDDLHLTPQAPSWPAAFDSVVAVGATSRDGKLAPFSPKAPWVDLLAPGVDVESTYLKGEFGSVHAREQGDDFVPFVEDLPKGFDGFARWSGTSFAAAHVSGQIAADIATSAGTTAVQRALERLSNPGEQNGTRINPFGPQDLG
jgi:subtilisin family serine protease